VKLSSGIAHARSLQVSMTAAPDVPGWKWSVGVCDVTVLVDSGARSRRPAVEPPASAGTPASSVYSPVREPHATTTTSPATKEADRTAMPVSVVARARRDRKGDAS
jgi:hypothetical protein